MIDLAYLKELLPILKANGCSKFTTSDLELCFDPKSSTSVELTAKPDLIEVDDSHLPPDLKGDDLFNADKVLHWSSGGEEGGMPLTGEEEGV